MTKYEIDLKKEVGKRIQMRRDELTMKQDTLADDLEIDRTHISRIERGERNITIDMLKQISQKLNVSTDYLLGLTDCKTPKTDYRAFCDSTGLDDTTTEILEEINFVYEGQYLIPIINFLIKQEKLPPNEAFFEEKYRKIENSKISEKEKKNKIRQVKNIYDRMYQRWKDKECQPILSSIEDYYTTKIDNKNLYLDFFGNIKKEEDFTNELNKLSIKKKVPYQKLFEKICLDNITENLKNSKQKFLKGADKK